VGNRHGAAWTWTDTMLAELPAKVVEGEAVAR
jgi:hypothetical protein